MSSEFVFIKEEPKTEPADEQEHIERDCAENQPEYVNIKIEFESQAAEVRVKAEPKSDDEDASEEEQHTWYVPETTVTVKAEPLDCTVKKTLPPDEPEELVVTPIIYEANTSNNAVVSDNELQPHKLPNGQYSCPLCDKIFTTKGHAQRHLTLHSRTNYPCNLCGKNFTREELLKSHIAKQHDRNFPCDECPKVFRSASNLQQHKRSHSNLKPYFCEKCHRYFAIKANLAKHQGKSRCRRPIDEPIQCHVCHKIFDKEFLLKSHLRRHTTEKPYNCDTCKMDFKYKSTLLRHLQIHKTEKAFTCTICNKPFTHPGLIKPHMRIHTGEKPYECPVCKKKFSHKHNMQRHAQRHEKIKHTTCMVCNKKFPKESRLRYHMRIHSEEKLPFKCQICPKKFSHKQNIVRHYSKKHPNKTYDEKLTDAGVALKIWQEVQKKSLNQINEMKKEKQEIEIEIKQEIVEVDNEISS